MNRLAAVLVAAALVGCARVETLGPAAPADLPPPVGARAGGAAPSAGAAPPAVTVPGSGVEVPPPMLPRVAAGPLPPLTLPPETGNVRALWVVRTALSHPDSARAVVHRARDAGFNTLLVQVRGRGDAYYDSRWEPWPDPLGGAPRSWDPLAVVLDEAHRVGLRVHAWVNVHLVASAALPPRDPGHLARSRPELLAVPRSLALELFHTDPRDPRYLDALLRYTAANGDRVEGLYTSPAHPRVQDHLHFVLADLVGRYPVDGVHLDYVRYPSPDFDYSRGALEAFRDWVRGGGWDASPEGRTAATADGLTSGRVEGAEHLWGRDPLAYTATFPTLWDTFRREQVTLTVERLYRTVKATRPGTVVSTAVFANADDAWRSRYQDWEGWLRTGIVDVVAPMAYTPNGGDFERQISRAASHDPRRVWAGLGIYQDSFSGAVGKGRSALGMGVGGIALFSYDWAVGPEGSAVAGGGYLTRYVRELWGR